MNTIKIQGSPSRPGPEADLVLHFIHALLMKNDGRGSRTVFIEPPIGAVKPDIVVVDWDHSVTSSWTEERQSLTKSDLQIAQMLYVEGPLKEERIRYFFKKQTNSSLKRLKRADLIEFVNQRWSLHDLSEIFAVRRIIAFEAKVTGTRKAVKQAYFNTWFASESYIITTVKKPAKIFLQQAQHYGVGFWLMTEESCVKPLLLPKKFGLPQSYASWLFNELVWEVSSGPNDDG